MPQMAAEAEGRNRATSVWHPQRPQLNGSLNYHLNRISFGRRGGVIQKDKLHCKQCQNSLMTHMK